MRAILLSNEMLREDISMLDKQDQSRVRTCVARTLTLLKICDYTLKNVIFHSQNKPNKNQIFELIQDIMVIKLLY